MSREQRILAMWKSMKRSRSYQYEHYRKGWIDGPYMQIARTFRIPIREVKEILANQKGGNTSA